MSQDYTSSSRKQKRSARSTRNRPILVSTNGNGQNDANAETTETTETVPSTMPVQELSAADIPTFASTPAPSPTLSPTSKRRFAGFLPAIGKSGQETRRETAQVDVAQARIARATRNKGQTTQTSAVKEVNPVETKTTKAPASASTTSSKTTPARPASAFKTRYIFGMVLYLLAANFIGVFEAGVLQSYHLDSTLTSFNLFGGTIIIRVSTLVFLATLILILVLLARLDLIPRSFSAATGTSARKTSSSSTNTSADGDRNTLPLTRQGVKGADDRLYQEYRANLRKKK